MVKKKKAKGQSEKPDETVQLFMELVREYGYQQATGLKRLTNFTFFAGAGFSKSWDPLAPVGAELFTLDSKVVEKVADFGALSRMFGLSALNNITPDQLRQIVYQIDMYDRYPDVRSRYVDEQNLRMFRGALRAAVVDRYEQITNLNYFDKSAQKFPPPSTSQQCDIVNFFRYLLDRTSGSFGQTEGIRTQFITTNYDFVIETILDNVLGFDDSLFLYTYRGFTPKEIINQPNMTPIHEHWLVQHLLKINGGFEILRRGDDYVLDYSKRSSDTVLSDPPILMLASREQNYSDPYFKTIFPKVVRLLRDTTVLVIVGYSLPQDDALIRFFIRQFAEEPEDGHGKIIFYVGPGTEQDKRSDLEEVFPAMEMEGAPHLAIYNGGFDKFAADCLKIAELTSE